MATQKKPKDRKDTASDESSSVKTEDVLRPFQDASVKFLQTNFSAQESAIKQRAQAYLDLQAEVRKVEQEAYDAVMEANRKHVNKMGQQATSNSMEEMYSERAQSQFDYEREVRQVYIDAQAKLKAIAQKAFGEEGGDETKQFANQRQDAYQSYLADLQQAWSDTKALDPQTMNAIASHILFTINFS